jgi:hypothetical protein
MKMLFWVGLAVLILGIASFVVPVPHSENHGIKAGDIISTFMVLGGVGMMIAGGRGH